MSDHYKNTGPVDCSLAPDISRLEGKSVIVTGGSSGLGAGYVAAFLKAGAFVTNADMQDSFDDKVLKSKDYQYVKCDVRSWTEQLQVFRKATETSPNKNIDVVVANAGISGPDPVFALDEGEEPLEPDLRIININFIGVVYTTKLALHYFNRLNEKSDKCLILKSSLAGYLDLTGSPSYQSSKYAVRALMSNLRWSGRCRVNLIAPWFIATPIMKETEIKALTAGLEPLESGFALAEDAAKAVVRVAADESINGRSLAIVHRGLRREGYMDLEHDDYPTGSVLEELQTICVTMGMRRGPSVVR